jgi:hypothetical protein
MSLNMMQEISKMSEKFSGEKRVRDLVEAVAGPRAINDSRESWLRRAARLAGTSYRQAKALFYSEISDPHHPTVTKFKEAAGRHEARLLAEQYERLAVALDQKDPDFHGPDIVALLHAARALRSLDRTRNGGGT